MIIVCESDTIGPGTGVVSTLIHKLSSKTSDLHWYCFVRLTIHWQWKEKLLS